MCNNYFPGLQNIIPNPFYHKSFRIWAGCDPKSNERFVKPDKQHCNTYDTCTVTLGLRYTARLGKKHANFAQWRYSNQWSNREVLLLLVENYTQYPALPTWNTVCWCNFCRLLRELITLQTLPLSVETGEPTRILTTLLPPPIFKSYYALQPQSIPDSRVYWNRLHT